MYLAPKAWFALNIRSLSFNQISNSLSEFALSIDSLKSELRLALNFPPVKISQADCSISHFCFRNWWCPLQSVQAFTHKCSRPTLFLRQQVYWLGLFQPCWQEGRVVGIRFFTASTISCVAFQSIIQVDCQEATMVKQPNRSTDRSCILHGNMAIGE